MTPGKLTVLKFLGAAALAGVAAASQQSGPKGPRRTKGGCTPCEAQAKLDAARARVRNGSL